MSGQFLAMFRQLLGSGLDLKSWKLGAILSVLVVLLTGCGGGEAPSDTFIFARGSDAQKLDPADIDDGESANTLAQICEGLVRFKSGTLDIEPALAESYEISEDGLTYRFNLREGVQFHDGTPLNAETALFTFQRQIDESHPGHLDDAAFAYWKGLYMDVESVRAADEMTLEFTLSKPNASMLRNFAIFPAFLVSPAALETYGDAFQHNPIGTGPFKFVEWRSDEVIILERNENYWGEKPSMERLIISVVPENSVRLLRLESGDIHGMDGAQPAELKKLESNPDIDVYRDTGLNVGYMTYNLEVERMQIRDVREAIALAIDRDRLAEIAFSGYGRSASYPMPPGFLGYPEKEEAIPLNLERARTLLAPHMDKFDTPIRLSVMSDPRPYFPNPQNVAAHIQSELEKIGLPVDVRVRDFKSHLNDLRNGDFELGLIGWMSDNGDTDNFLSIFFGSWEAVRGTGNNYAMYRSEEMDALLQAGRSETDSAKRAEIYEKALQVWRRDLPLLPLIHGDQIILIRSQFEGFELQLVGDLRLGWIKPKQ